LYLAVAGDWSEVGGAEAASAGPEVAPETVVDAATARQVFERFRALSGEWRGRSSTGWTDRSSVRVIAAGSVVVATSDFEAHPHETMITLYHLDGPRMMLTHYCVAQNQPRLQVTGVRDRGRSVTFSFRDGTNLLSRNQGHMDQAVFEFQDDDHFSSRWSFYRDGRKDWMEEIHYERIR
jgi:hypothetical protein